MNLVLALSFIVVGGVLVYSGFKNLTIPETIQAINGIRTGAKVTPTKMELAALANGSVTSHKTKKKTK